MVNNYDYGTNEGKLNVYGSIQQNARGPVGTFDPYTCTAASGYTKHYTWDPLLDYVSPPSYLVPSTAPWTLTSVNANGGQKGTSVCPVLTGVYDGTTSPTPITQYCSQATGGLPGYPAITAPSPPTHVYATANTGGVATVNWTDPSDNGSPILHYDVEPEPGVWHLLRHGRHRGHGDHGLDRRAHARDQLHLHRHRHQRLRHERPVRALRRR